MSEEEEAEYAAVIKSKLEMIYGDQEPLFVSALDFGDAFLRGFEVYRSENGGPHWHYISYGFTDIAGGSEDGFELTFRLKQEDESVPQWPFHLMNNIAKYVSSADTGFSPGHYIDCNGPICLPTEGQPGTKLVALGFVVDEELGVLETKHGKLNMLQAIGLTSDELSSLIQWSGKSFLHQVMMAIPMGVTDLYRKSLMGNAEFRKSWEEGVNRDGSAIGFMHLSGCGFAWDELSEGRYRLTCGAKDVDVLGKMLKARVGKGRRLVLHGDAYSVVLDLADEFRATKLTEHRFDVTLPPVGISEICELMQPHVGYFHMEKIPLDLNIIRSEIRDQGDTLIQVVE